MGVVHLALDRSGRAVALKLLRPHIAYDPDARSRLAREVDVLGRVQDPRVAAVIDADLDGDQPYVVTRYVPGPSLDEVVREHGPLAGRELHRLASGLAGALHAIHEADVIHRDLKPANVLLLDGDPVVIDFGIAHIADDVRLTMTGLVMGTPGYLSPEVVEGAPVTEATDWWGWAATLAFAASGAPPFGRGPMDVVLNRVSRGEADLSGVDPRLAPLLYAALSPDPRQRPDADEVVEALERYAAGKPATEVLPQAPAARHTQVIDQRATRAWDQPPPVGPLSLPVDHEPWQRPAPPPPPPDDDRDSSVLAHWDPPADDVSDWQAAWEADPGEPDPRIGRPNRSGTLLALLLAVVAVAANWPVVAAVVIVAWCWMARTAERSVTSLVMRRHHRGRRRSDVPFAVAASPWHLVVGALGTLMGLLLPALVGDLGRLQHGARDGGADRRLTGAELSRTARSRWSARGAHGLVGSGRGGAAPRHPQRGARPDPRAASGRRWPWWRVSLPPPAWPCGPTSTTAHRCGGRGRRRPRSGQGWAWADDGCHRGPSRASRACLPAGPCRAGRACRGPCGAARSSPRPSRSSTRCASRPTATLACSRLPPRSARPGHPSTSHSGWASSCSAAEPARRRSSPVSWPSRPPPASTTSRSTSRCSRCWSSARPARAARSPCCGWCARRTATSPGWSRCTSSSRTSSPAATTARQRRPGCARSAGCRGSGRGGSCTGRWACSRAPWR